MKTNNKTVLGLQWGDEGKGKVIDYLCRDADIVVRFGGGANAGHTVVTDKGKFVLHLLPSGIVQSHTTCYLGAGVVCDPWALLDEIDMLEKSGINTVGRIFVDFGTHLVLPHHKAIDRHSEQLDKGTAIATTLRGIGPAYADKALRIGITASALCVRNTLESNIKNFILRKRPVLESIGDPELLLPDRLIEQLGKVEARIAGMVGDVTAELRQASLKNKKILFEGAQGTLLDISLGTYPFVTSSSTSIGGLFGGLGVPPGIQGEVLGVIKAYTTRVGNGPFPTELDDEIGEHLRQKGNEYGATTGRPRRTGWLDLAAIRRSAYICGVDKLVVTKLDVLDGLNEIKICLAYRHKGQLYDFPPLYADFFETAEPVYDTLPGWSKSTSNLKSSSALPKEARGFLDFIQENLGVSIKYVSTGSHTESMIEM